MSMLAVALPIPPGKAKSLEQHARETTEREDLDETIKSFGISHESWHLQESPQGDMVVLVFEANDPLRMLKDFAESEKALPRWQKECLREILGIDFAQPPPGSPSRVIFQWPPRHETPELLTRSDV